MKLVITTQVNDDSGEVTHFEGDVAEVQFTAGPDGVGVMGKYKVTPSPQAEMIARLKQLSQKDSVEEREMNDGD